MTARRQIPCQLVLPLVPGQSRKSRASLVQRIDVRWQEKAYCAGYLDTDDFYPEDEARRGVRRRRIPRNSAPSARSSGPASLLRSSPTNKACGAVRRRPSGMPTEKSLPSAPMLTAR